MTDNQSRACCACLTVVYDPVHNANGTCTERWSCKQCGRVFGKILPDNQSRAARVEAAARDVTQFLRTFSRHQFNENCFAETRKMFALLDAVDAPADPQPTATVTVDRSELREKIQLLIEEHEDCSLWSKQTADRILALLPAQAPSDDAKLRRLREWMTTNVALSSAPNRIWIAVAEIDRLLAEPARDPAPKPAQAPTPSTKAIKLARKQIESLIVTRIPGPDVCDLIPRESVLTIFDRMVPHE